MVAACEWSRNRAERQTEILPINPLSRLLLDASLLFGGHSGLVAVSFFLIIGSDGLKYFSISLQIVLCFRFFYLYIATLLLYRSLIGSGPMFAGPAAAVRSVNVDNMMKGQ